MTDLGQKQLLRQHDIYPLKGMTDLQKRASMKSADARDCGEQTDETKSETATLLSELGAVEQRATALQVAEDLDPNRGEIERRRGRPGAGAAGRAGDRGRGAHREHRAPQHGGRNA